MASGNLCAVEDKCKNFLQKYVRKLTSDEYSEDRNKQTVDFSPQVNYTDWATTTGQRILVPTFADTGVSRGQRGGTPTAINLGF
jgi:hypothetical protein